ncbi:hypothetical protein AALP_AA3G351700 [Arabis alpina]|uniref:Uncharacterized protein n=1 Tax=Arabis alpina TaxID=50452 RepID=A0A087HDR2_ARAAL|nr:hypothetical protein AALP_AA3G351700 [Arabis alpina]
MAQEGPETLQEKKDRADAAIATMVAKLGEIGVKLRASPSPIGLDQALRFMPEIYGRINDLNDTIVIFTPTQSEISSGGGITPPRLSSGGESSGAASSLGDPGVAPAAGDRANTH